MSNEFVMVPRELAARIARAGCWPNDAEELRALLGQSVEQHQDEPVALPARKAITAHGLTALDSEAEGWNACVDEISKLGPLYTHPALADDKEQPACAKLKVRELQSGRLVVEVAAFDAGQLSERGIVSVYTRSAPGEVERLRAALKFYADREHYHFESGNWDTVSGEPLNILWCGDEPDFIEDGTVARNALSASAEPSAPVEIDERAEFETRYGPDTWEHLNWSVERQAWECRAALERKP